MLSIFSSYRRSFADLQRNIWILSIGMFINRSGSMVMLFASLYFSRELHFSIGQAGILMSFFGAGGILGSYAGGWLTDRKNHLDIMLLSLITSGLILLLLQIATDPVFIAAIIFCYSFTADLFRPANSSAIACYTTPEDRTRSISLMRFAANLGFTVGPAVGGIIALHFGYKWLFLADSLTSFAAALMLKFYLPRQPVEKKSEEHHVLADNHSSAYRDGRYLLFILLVAIYGICFFQIITSIPQYFSTQCNYHEDKIGWLLALNGLLVVLIEMPLITALAKQKNAFFFIIGGTLCIPLAMIILWLGRGMMTSSVIFIIILSLSEICAIPFMMNHVLSLPVKERQGQYAALFSMAFGIAIMAGPPLGLGIAGRYGFDIMFYFFIALSTITAVGFGLLNNKLKRSCG